MSNIAQSVGNALIDEAARFGIELYVNPEGNQVLTRNVNKDPATQVRPGLMTEIVNSRGSILIALMAKQGIKSEDVVRAELSAARAKAIEAEALAKRAEQEQIRLHGKVIAPITTLSPEDAAAVAAFEASLRSAAK